MNKLVLGNLFHRPIRVAISVLAVAIEVIMILSITGVFIGQVSGSRASTLGVGADMVIQPPNASWGTLITDGQSQLYTRPWVSLAPGIALAVSIVLLNVVADGVRDAIDPRGLLPRSRRRRERRRMSLRR